MIPLGSLIETLSKNNKVHFATLKAKAFFIFDCRPFGYNFTIFNGHKKLGRLYKPKFHLERIHLQHIWSFRYPYMKIELGFKFIKNFNL